MKTGRIIGTLLTLCLVMSISLQGFTAETGETDAPAEAAEQKETVQEETAQEETVQETPAPEVSASGGESAAEARETSETAADPAKEEAAGLKDMSSTEHAPGGEETLKEELPRTDPAEEILSEDGALTEEFLEEESPESTEAEEPRSPFTEVDGKLFYYVNDRLQTGWKTVEGRQYYFKPGNPDKGMMLTGKQKIGGKWYFLDPEKKTGFIRKGEVMYYAGTNGVLRTGWQTISGRKYYFWGSTKKGHIIHEAAFGFRSINGAYYLLDPDDCHLLYGLNEYNGRKYYSNNKGKLQKGFQTISKVRYYFDSKPDPYAGHEGRLTEKNKQYICFEGRVQTGLISFEGELYYGDSKGVLQTGWRTIDNRKYYFLPKASASQPVRAAVKGTLLQGDTLYFFDDNGVLDENRTVKTGLVQKDGKWHYVYSTSEDGHEAGQMATGPVYYQNNYYQFDENGDSISGWQTIDGDYAWFNDRGMLVKDKAAMKLTVIDYGNTNGSYGSNYGDPTLMESDGHYMLIDTALPNGGKKIIRKLKEMGVRRLSIYVSHYHNDHTGSVPAILKDKYFTVEKIYLEDPTYLYGEGRDTQPFAKNIPVLDETIKMAETKGIPVITLNTGDTFECGLVKASVLYRMAGETPFTGDAKNNESVSSYINNMSLCTRFTCGNVRFLHCGDIEKDTEKDILDRNIDLTADIFKLNHHGGLSSNTSDFLNAVQPAFCYFSNPGDKSRLCQDSWTSPVVKNAQSKGANVFHPIVNGHTTFSVTGGSIFVNTVRRSKTVNVRVINKITRKQETIKVKVQASANGKYTIHENMIPFYYDLL